MKKMLFAALAALVVTTTAHAETMRVPMNVSQGFMHVRSGPGTNYKILAAAPAGTTFSWEGSATCVKRQDGKTGPDWCSVTYNGVHGWVSKLGLEPVFHDCDG